LTFVGAKMLLADIYKVPTELSLLVVVGIIGLSVVASLVWPPAEAAVPVVELPQPALVPTEEVVPAVVLVNQPTVETQRGGDRIGGRRH
jgi:hypothetical protein